MAGHLISSQRLPAGSKPAESVCLPLPRVLVTQCRQGASMCRASGEGQPGTPASLVKEAWARPLPLPTSKIMKVKFRVGIKGRMLRTRRTGEDELAR